MQTLLESLRRLLFTNISPSLCAPFAEYSAQRNSARFSILPFFNLATQIICYVIYLYIYPAVYPDRVALDTNAFAIFSGIYVLINMVFIVLFISNAKNRERASFVKTTHRLTLLFLLCYISLESADMLMEVRVSGNIYRFLATYFTVALLPVLPRKEKLFILLFYLLMAEIGFGLAVSRGLSANFHYAEIAVLFFIACLLVSNITYSSLVRIFTLNQNLLEANRQLQLVNDQLALLSTTDALTGIANRRVFNDHMTRMWNERKRLGIPLTVFMIDVDNFKDYNDSYGHQKGDESLIAIAQYIHGFFKRSTDLVARYGGEEFIVLLTNTEPVARTLAESLRAGVEDLHIEHNENSANKLLTISVGVGVMAPSKENKYEDLIALADDALYRAKHGGRNRVYFNELGSLPLPPPSDPTAPPHSL